MMSSLISFQNNSEFLRCASRRQPTGYDFFVSITVIISDRNAVKLSFSWTEYLCHPQLDRKAEVKHEAWFVNTRKNSILQFV